MNNLVSINHRSAITTSLKVAAVFGKKHQHVLDSIRKINCSQAFWRTNFRPRNYCDERGKVWPMFEITRDGFSFLAMGFTGKKAAQFKEQFIDAFNQMEQALLNQQNLSWQQQRLDGKTARRRETDAIARFCEYAAAQGSQHASAYFLNITKMTNQALCLGQVAQGRPIRDSIDAIQLSFLAAVEYLIQQALDEGMAAGLHYKAIFQGVRECVARYADALPIQKRLLA